MAGVKMEFFEGNPRAAILSRHTGFCQPDVHHSVDDPHTMTREWPYGRGAQDLAGARVERRPVQRADEAETP